MNLPRISNRVPDFLYIGNYHSVIPDSKTKTIRQLDGLVDSDLETAWYLNCRACQLSSNIGQFRRIRHGDNRIFGSNRSLGTGTAASLARGQCDHK